MDNWYIVTKRSDETQRIVSAKSGDAARRQVCRGRGVSPSDYFCGISNYHARRISESEVNAEYGKFLRGQPMRT